jgi:hypothetical protein
VAKTAEALGLIGTDQVHVYLKLSDCQNGVRTVKPDAA